MKKDKLFAPFLTLLVAAITLGATLAWGYKLSRIVWILLVVIIVFYIVGLFIQTKVNKFIELNEEAAREEAEKEGAVIEKDAPDGDAFDDNEDSEDGFALPPLTGAMPENMSEELDSYNEFRTREE